jgi:hypothetical protein
MQSPRTHFAPLLIATLAISGCGGSPDTAGASTPAPTAAATPAAGTTGPTATAPQSDEALTTLLAAYRKAAGGDALDRIKSFRATGVTFSVMDKSNRRLVVQAEAIGKFRQYEAPINSDSRPQVSVIGLDGTAGWRRGNTLLAGDGLSRDPKVREKAITQASRQNYVNAVAGLFPLLLKGDPTITMQSLGPVTDGPDRGAPAVSISTPDGLAGRLIFDPATSLPMKFIAPYQKHIRKQGGEYAIVFSDFRVVDGIRVPFRVARTDELDRQIRWSFSGIEWNPTFDPKAFTKQ